MAQILGSAQNIEIDITGAALYKNLVCLRTSSVNTTMDATTDQTNCGVLTAPSQPQITIDFDAICETSPSASQISYNNLLFAITNKLLITARVQNPVVSGSSTGGYYYHQFAGYITDLTLNQASAEFMNFSGTIQSTGAINIVS